MKWTAQNELQNHFELDGRPLLHIFNLTPNTHGIYCSSFVAQRLPLQDARAHDVAAAALPRVAREGGLDDGGGHDVFLSKCLDNARVG